MPGLKWIYVTDMLVNTPWRHRRNALNASCALCARCRCAVTTLCMPRARHERSVTTRSIAGQNSVGARWHAMGAPRKRLCRRGRAVTSSLYGKMWNYSLYFCPACRTTLVATRFRVAVICPIIQVPHCIRVFFYFVWFVFINHIFQFYYELCTYCNILDIYLS